MFLRLPTYCPAMPLKQLHRISKDDQFPNFAMQAIHRDQFLGRCVVQTELTVTKLATVRKPTKLYHSGSGNLGTGAKRRGV